MKNKTVIKRPIKNKTVKKKIKLIPKVASQIKQLLYADREVYKRKFDFQYDSDIDCGYINLYRGSQKRPTIVSSQSLTDWLIVDRDIHNRVIGIEILNVLKNTIYQNFND